MSIKIESEGTMQLVEVWLISFWNTGGYFCTNKLEKYLTINLSTSLSKHFFIQNRPKISQKIKQVSRVKENQSRNNQGKYIQIGIKFFQTLNT